MFSIHVGWVKATMGVTGYFSIDVCARFEKRREEMETKEVKVERIMVGKRMVTTTA